MRTRVKICGLTRTEDVELAVALGADALGFNLYPESPRYVDERVLLALLKSVPPFVCKVGLFVNASVEHVEASLAKARFDMLQFSGDEDDEFCQQFGVPYIKAIRSADPTRLKSMADEFPASEGILLDAHVDGLFGGTGQPLAWDQLPAIDHRIILAGGLNAENVRQAIKLTKPWSVDVSSGVESKPGHKAQQKMQNFFIAVNAADRSS